jgi:EpsI family protein
MKAAAATIIITASLGITVAVTSIAEKRTPEPLVQPLESIPSEIAGWQLARHEKLAPAILTELRPTSYISRQYTKGAGHAGVFVAFYGAQQGGEGLHSPKNCLPGGGWTIEEQQYIELPASTPATINRCVIRKNANKVLMLYWYQTRERVCANEYAGKFLLIRDALLSRSTGSSIVRVTLPVSEFGSRDATPLASELLVHVQRCLGS